VSKSVRILIALAAVVAMATPALAEFTLGGYFRTQGYLQNIETKNSGGGLYGNDDSDTMNVIDQRFRAKLGYTLNDYVSFVYYGEVDTTWGEQSKGGIGGGGMVGADGVNIETKNIYVDFKMPDANSNLRLGIQGIKDSFDGVVFFNDMAAINLSGKAGLLDYALIYSKWSEGDEFEFDDTDFYALDVSHKYGDYAKAGVAVYYYDNNGEKGFERDANGFPEVYKEVDKVNIPVGFGANVANEGPDYDAELWYGGLYGDYRFANMGLQGWILYQDGEVYDGSTDVDSQAWAASVKANFVVRNGDLGLRYMYFSPDDDEDDLDRFFMSHGNYEFIDENLSIFLVDRFVNNVNKNRLAIYDSVEGGYGLHGVVFSGNFKNLPIDTYAGFGAGAFFAADDNPDGAEKREGSTLGYELAGRIGKIFADKFDVSLRGAYAILGDFYDETAPGDDDPDDVWTTTLMVNVPF
jgi:hypothetical protein